MKKHYKFIVGIIVGLILSSVIGYAKTVLTSNEVVYDNTTSKLSSTNVKDAIDEVNEKATTKLEEAKNSCPDGYECNKIPYFAYIIGDFTEKELRAKNITDYTAVGKNVFAALGVDGITGGVGIYDEELLYLGLEDEENNILKIKEHFGENNCTTDGGSLYDCSSSNFDCVVAGDSYVTCKNIKTKESCLYDNSHRFSCK